MQIYIEDDFDLEKIAKSGQCFRVALLEGNIYRFITKENILYIRQLSDGLFDISCGKDEWDKTWKQYFALDINYNQLRKDILGKNLFIDKVVENGKGIRILRQDPWEMLITFIASQRKSIPAISSSIEQLSLKYGKPISTEYETVYSFPEADSLRRASIEDLQKCAFGYRSSYISNAIQLVSSKQLDLFQISNYDDDNLFQELINIKGVGKKVANCVMLFAYGRTERAPIDVWIKRAIDSELDGNDPFGAYGEYAGVVQQYIFYYQKSHQS